MEREFVSKSGDSGLIYLSIKTVETIDELILAEMSPGLFFTKKDATLDFRDVPAWEQVILVVCALVFLLRRQLAGAV